MNRRLGTDILLDVSRQCQKLLKFPSLTCTFVCADMLNLEIMEHSELKTGTKLNNSFSINIYKTNKMLKMLVNNRFTTIPVTIFIHFNSSFLCINGQLIFQPVNIRSLHARSISRACHCCFLTLLDVLQLRIVCNSGIALWNI